MKKNKEKRFDANTMVEEWSWVCVCVFEYIQRKENAEDEYERRKKNWLTN